MVVTGLGTVSGVGIGAADFLAALRSGTNGFSAIEDSRLAHLKSNRVARVHSSVLTDPLPEALAGLRVDNIVRLILRAADEALTHASMRSPLGPRSGVVIGTCSGGMQSIETHYESLFRHEDSLDEQLLFAKRYYTPAKVLAFLTGASGPMMTVVTACAAGAGAIAEAVNLIRLGHLDVALAGGADTFAPSTLIGFDALKATCEGICTPFSTNIGLNLGEGAGMLVLESLESARTRGVPILAEILGAGLSNDAYHPTSPDPSCRAQLKALERTLRDAGRTPADIDYINAHGTGTRANDAVESKTIVKFLGPRAKSVPVSSTKSLIGHCLGAAGALETAATILTTRSGFCPQTVGFEAPRDGCTLDYVSDPNRPFSGRIALTNSFGFGGNNACLLLDTEPDPEDVPISDHPRIRPVVTGVGAVHALGVGMAPIVSSDERGIRYPQRISPEDPDALAGLVPPIDLRRVDRRLDFRGLGRMASYATVAARAALATGGIRPKPSVTADIGVVMGLASGDTEAESSHLTATFDNDFELDRVESFPFVVQNAAAGQMARVLLLKGHSTVLSTGWGAGLSALLAGSMAIICGQSDTLLATACDVITPRSFEDARTIGLFDSLIPGEGSAALLLEHPNRATARGATVLAEVLGYASATDVDDPMTFGREAVHRALDQALSMAEVRGSTVSRVGLALSDHPAHREELDCASKLLPNAAPVSLYPRLGFSEAALSLFNFAYLMEISPRDTLLAVLSLSLEGVASAVVLKRQ